MFSEIEFVLLDHEYGVEYPGKRLSSCGAPPACGRLRSVNGQVPKEVDELHKPVQGQQAIKYV
mgnify:CR=1 FL=1